MTDTLRIGLLQTAPQLGEVAANIAELGANVQKAGDNHIVVAPELATHGYHLGDCEDVESVTADDPRLKALGHHGPTAVVGFVETRGAHRFNSAAVIDRDEVGVQRKLYLPTYRDWEEHKHFRPGQRVHAFHPWGAHVSVIICNDLWHSPVPWLAAHAGAEVIITIANSVHSEAARPVQDAWDVLLTHTALALQTYVVFVNRSGSESGATFWGGSRVIGPDGSALITLGPEPDIGTAEIDLAGLRSLRHRWPMLKESRFDLIAREARRLADAELEV